MRTAQENLLAYLKGIYPSWEASGSLQRMKVKNADGTLATPRSLVRRLEELREDGKLEVEYRGKNHAFYCFNKANEPKPDPRLSISKMMEEQLSVYD